MPPKKKGKITSPIVVGTVSTRSTRRQSVVNIEIPKTKSKTMVKDTKKDEGPLFISSFNPQKRFENIKITYSKVEPTVKPLVIQTDEHFSQKPKYQNVSPSNKALQQILEDWSDDESQEDKTGTTSADSSDEASFSAQHIYNLEFGVEEIKKIMGGEYTPSKSISTEFEKIIRKEEQPETKDVIDIESDVNEIVVECVTEEIVDDNEIVIIEENTLSPENDQEGKENVLVDESVLSPNVEVDVVIENDDASMMDQGQGDTIIIEETSQSISTSDSNDSEVRKFFAKEIEKNEIVIGKPIPKMEFSEEKIDSEVEIEGLQDRKDTNTQMVQEVDVEEDSDCCSNVVRVEESISESTEDKIIEEIVEEVVETSTAEFQPLEEVEVVVEEKSVDTEDDKDIKAQTVETCIAEEVEVGIKKCESEFPQEVEKFLTDFELEDKVAGLNLKDAESTDDTGIADKVAELKLDTPKVRISSKELERLLNDDNQTIRADITLQRAERLKKIANRAMQDKLKNTDQKPLEKVSKSKDRKVIASKVAKSSKSKVKIPRESKSKQREKKVDMKSKKKLQLALSPKKLIEIPEKKLEDKDRLLKIEDTGNKKDKKIKMEESLEKKDKKLKLEESSEKKEKKIVKTESDQEKFEIDFDDTEVRRSSRIKSISILKKRTTGHGLVRSRSEPSLNESDVSDSNSTFTESEKGTPSASPKTVKERKTRWSKSNENLSFETPLSVIENQGKSVMYNEKPKLVGKDPVVETRLKQFVHLKENSYKTDRMTCKEAKKMTCDCFLTPEEIVANEYGCGEDCLNRLLLIECGTLCQVTDRCTNKRFQKNQFAPVEVFNTEKIGLGLRAAANIPYGEFILEYVGEVLNIDEFDKRAEVYSQDKNIHFYFMALRADAIIDATMKGNISRFINHSCDPNAETQKWTVNGELRIGFFSTRTILAGEEITFDYRFQRYGKEAQKCYCGAAICRGWLGEQPDSEEEEEEEEEEDEEETSITAEIKAEVPSLDVESKLENIEKLGITEKPPEESKIEGMVTPAEAAIPAIATTPDVKLKKKLTKRKPKPRIELFEEIDQLNEDIEMLMTTGLKNQAHTLKLSRLMVRAKEPQQRTKLLKILRRGELPCRRLFLDYHGLRLIHGYMIDAQHLVISNKKFESLRLEMLQTLAVLPIPNKSMLQDSKVLLTVEKWTTKDLSSPGDSDSNSPKDSSESPQKKIKPEEMPELKREDGVPERSIEDQEEEIRFLAGKLLEEWSNLKEVFRIPKKERIEQMKEHEREANKKFMQSSHGMDQYNDRKSDRYRPTYKYNRDYYRKNTRPGEKYSAEFLKLSKIERRKLFALQHELKEEERRLKQREMWRQHEMNCMMIGSDPRFTAPFDPSKPYQLIWNPQLGQWQNYPLPQSTLLSPQPPIPNLNLSHPQIPKPMSYHYASPLSVGTSMGPTIPQLPPKTLLPPPSSVPQMSPLSVLGQPLPTHSQAQVPINPLQQTLAPHLQKQPPLPVIQQPMLNTLPQTLQPQIPSNSSTNTVLQMGQYPEKKIKEEEDFSHVKFKGPIPPPVKLPPKWKCATDKYGRPYYYHIKFRKSQWEPPPLEPLSEEQEEFSETDSSSDTSSISSDSSSENSDSEAEIDDTKLLLAVRRQMESASNLVTKNANSEQITTDPVFSPTPSSQEEMDIETEEEDVPSMPAVSYAETDLERTSIDIRLKEQFNFRDDKPPKKKRRVGLCEEILIEPRTEEDKIQAKEDLKRYKANKEKLRRQKELIVQQTKKQLRELELKRSREKTARTSLKVKIKEMPDFNSEAARKIKETFRNNMASTVVSSLNVYRKPDCKEGKITNTDDFKHLARKLTHFVMLKELKHITRIEDLTCTDNVKMKAREYIRKYMSKFGEVYVKRSDSPEFKD